jgi:transcriptional regulator with XRE-family HTH domain
MAHLGELIAELRQDRGLTQKEPGDILCVSSGTISNYENGVHLPDVDKVIALANYFHVTTDYLLGRTSSNLPVELLQQAITNEKTLGDVMASFAKLPANRQAALSLIISDMEVRQMIDTYSKTGDSK